MGHLSCWASLSSLAPRLRVPSPSQTPKLPTPYPPKVPPKSPLFNNTEQSWAGPEKVSSEEETETGDRVVRT